MHDSCIDRLNPHLPHQLLRERGCVRWRHSDRKRVDFSHPRRIYRQRRQVVLQFLPQSGNRALKDCLAKPWAKLNGEAATLQSARD